MAGRVRPLELIIKGVNRVAGPIREVNRQIESIQRPVRKLKNSLAELSKASGLTGVANSARRVGAEVTAVARGLARFGAVTAVGTFGLKRLIDYGDDVATVATNIGISTDALQELRYTAEQLDVSQTALDENLLRFNRVIAETAAGTGEGRIAFQGLGISVRDASGKLRTTPDLLEEVADKVSRLKDPAQRTRAAMLLFGRGGAEMVSMLAGGGSEIRRFSAEAREMGFVLDEAALKLAGEADVELRKLTTTFKAVALTIGTDLLPGFIESVRSMREFVKANREAIRVRAGDFLRDFASVVKYMAQILEFAVPRTLDLIDAIGGLKVVAAIVGAVYLRGLGVAIAKLTVSIGGVIARVPGVVAGLAKFGGAALGLAARALPLLVRGLAVLRLAFMANPIGLFVTVVAALVTLGPKLYESFEPFRKLVDGIWEALQGMYQSAKDLLGLNGPDGRARFQAGIEAAIPQTGEAYAFGRVPPSQMAQPVARVGGRMDIQVSTGRGTRAEVTRLESFSRGFDLDVGMSMVP